MKYLLKKESLLTCLFVASLTLGIPSLVAAQSSGSGGSFSPTAKPAKQGPISFNKIPFGSQTPNASLQPTTQVDNSTSASSARRPMATTQSNTMLPRQEANNKSTKGVGFGKPLSTNNGNATRQTNSGIVQPLPKNEDLTFCTVNFIDDIKLPAREVGVIKMLDVKEGEFVPSGKVVGQIDDDLYQQMLKQAELRYGMAKETAVDTTAIQAARKKVQVATIEAKKATKLAGSGSKSDSERMMAVYTQDLAVLELTKAEKDREKAYIEAQLALAQREEVKARLKRHILDVGFDSYVIEIMKHPGEHVNVGDEVMRIARMDKLEVEGTVDVAVLNAHEIINRPVTVTVQLARNEQQTFEGRITHVALERQTRDRYKVKAEINNRPVGGHWVLQPNMTVDMRIHLDN